MKSNVVRRFSATVACAALLLTAGPSRADDQLESTALNVAPADAAFLVTSVNLQDAWDDLLRSRLVQRLHNVPYVQRLIGEAKQQWDNPEGPVVDIKENLQNPMVKGLLRLGQDMFTDEVFVYGHQDWCTAIGGFVELNNKITSQMGQGPQHMEEYLETQLPRDLANIHLPTTVIGFRVENTDNAKLLLNGLDGILRGLGYQIPELRELTERLERNDLDDGLTLSLSLDTSLIPLDQLSGDEREIAERVQLLLGDRNFTVSLGLNNGMLLLVAGEGDAIIDEIGASADTLLGHAAVETLREAAPERLRSVSYVSAELREAGRQASMGNYFKRITSQFIGVIRSEADESPEVDTWIDEIERDAKWLDDALASAAPELGAGLGWQVAIDGGAEGFYYDWTDTSMLQNAQPLSIANHSGVNPLISFAFGQAPDPKESLEIAHYVLDAMPRHIKNFIAMAERDDDDRRQAEELLDSVWPLVLELFAVLETEIAPSLDARQSVFSLAAGWKIAELGPGAPPLPEPMPVPELALACQLSDRDQFLAGCESLFEVFDKFVELAKETAPQQVPAGYQIPSPVKESIQGGSRYYYAEVTDAANVDGFNPQVAVGEDVLVIGYSQRQVDDMLASKKTRIQPAWITPQSSVAAVWQVDAAGFVTLLRPWIEFGMLSTMGDLDTPVAPSPGPVPTGNDILQIWDCLTSFGKTVGSTEVNDDVVKSHFVWIEQ